MTKVNPLAFFYRFDGLSLVEGNKTAGFDLTIDSRALLALSHIKVEQAQQLRVIEDAKERIARAKLLPKSLLKGASIMYWEDTLVPRFFQGDPTFGGSIGADPETFSRLTRPDAMQWLMDEVRYSPHNIDTAKMALALVVLAQTWGEYASHLLYDAWNKGEVMSNGLPTDLALGSLLPINDPENLMTVAEFETGDFISDDGSGAYATAQHYAPDASVWGPQGRPAWATHVLWHNR